MNNDVAVVLLMSEAVDVLRQLGERHRWWKHCRGPRKELGKRADGVLHEMLTYMSRHYGKVEGRCDRCFMVLESDESLACGRCDECSVLSIDSEPPTD